MHMLQLQGLPPVQANSHTYSMGVLYLPAYRVPFGGFGRKTTPSESGRLDTTPCKCLAGTHV